MMNQSTVTRQGATALILGAFLGFALSRLGFSDFTAVNHMFTLRDLRLVFTFAGALAILGTIYKILRTTHCVPEHRIHPGTITGGILFGLGWALTGACPSIPLVQLGEGKIYGLVTMTGVFLGMWIYRHVHARFFRWDVGSCE